MVTMDQSCQKEKSTKVLEIENLVKEYLVKVSLVSKEPFRAVDRVSLKIPSGDTVGLVGESGCGKSTLAKCILNLTRVNSGKVIYDGEEIQNLSDSEFLPYREKMQMVFQSPLYSFNPMMKVGQALMDPLRMIRHLNHREREEMVEYYLNLVGLDPTEFVSKYPNEMSGGQLQRVGVARALAVEPEFVFLDEPTSALDMSIRGQIVNLLLELQEKQSVSYIFVSHDLRVVRYIANRVFVMYLGEIVESGSKEDVFERPLHPYSRGLLTATFLGSKRRTDKKIEIKGEVVQETNVGCKLYNRCSYAKDRCKEEKQELKDVEGGRLVRCWRALEI